MLTLGPVVVENTGATALMDSSRQPARAGADVVCNVVSKIQTARGCHNGPPGPTLTSK